MVDTPEYPYPCTIEFEPSPSGEHEFRYIPPDVHMLPDGAPNRDTYQLLRNAHSVGRENLNQRLERLLRDGQATVDVFSQAIEVGGKVQNFLNDPRHWNLDDGRLHLAALHSEHPEVRLLTQEKPFLVLTTGADVMTIQEFCEILAFVLDLRSTPQVGFRKTARLNNPATSYRKRVLNARSD